MLLNPTLREHELHQKIHKLEEELAKVKRELEQKDMTHREEIQGLRERHMKEIS
jgi:hypothetical protein